MEFYEKINGYLEEIKEENEIFSKAQNPEEQIEAAATFWRAEEYHQQYFAKDFCRWGG